MSSKLITSDVILCLDSADTIYKNGYMVVENERISEIGYQKDLDSRRKFDETVELGARLVMPGLVNAHTHSPMTLFRGHVEGHTLFTLDGWFNTIRVLEMKIDSEMIGPGVAVSCAEMIRTGIPMIDLFNTLVKSQKLPIFSVSGEPYNQLLARIAMQAEVDLIVLGGMGLKFDDYLFFKDTLEEGGSLAKTIMFVHTAADPIVECLMVPDIALAVAEKFALKGKNVLVLLTDMTNFADALKEIAITQEQVPSNRGYPGDLYSQLASRYEKAVDFSGAGSITTLAVTTMPGDDVTHPIPDNTGYITEGQFYLHGGRIEPFGSLSRLKQMVNGKTREDHRAIMDGMVKLFAAYRDTLEKKSMGFQMTAWDRKLLKYGELFERRMMDLSVNIPLEKALDEGWEILSSCFEPRETGLRSDLIQKFWPASRSAAAEISSIKA